MSKKVCIIGAGSAGLVTARHLSECRDMHMQSTKHASSAIIAIKLFQHYFGAIFQREIEGYRSLAS